MSVYVSIKRTQTDTISWMNSLTKQFLYKTLLQPIPAKIRYTMAHYRMHKRFGKHTYRLNLDNPATFNEKITWLKLNHRFKDGPVIADKYLVREYVKEKIGDKYLIPLISVFNNTQEIDYSSLPKQFVLKPNHGSGWVIICMDRNKVDTSEFNKQLDRWLKLDFSYLAGEWQYKAIEKKIICERLIQELTEVVDYKFYCFNGKPKLVQVDVDRHTNHARSFYDLNWKKLDVGLLYPSGKKELRKPKNFQGMVQIAKKLSRDFTFCRVDLYNVDGRIYFGEITLHPEAGNGPFESYEQDLEMGKLLDITHLQDKYSQGNE